MSWRSASGVSRPSSSASKIIAKILIDLANERGKTVIVASHDPKVVEAFPRVWHMRDGAIERVS